YFFPLSLHDALPIWILTYFENRSIPTMTDASDLSRRSRWLAVALAEAACAKADPTHPLHRFDDSRFTVHDLPSSRPSASTLQLLTNHFSPLTIPISLPLTLPAVRTRRTP